MAVSVAIWAAVDIDVVFEYGIDIDFVKKKKIAGMYTRAHIHKCSRGEQNVC